jgi:hypothetical protein
MNIKSEKLLFSSLKVLKKKKTLQSYQNWKFLHDAFQNSRRLVTKRLKQQK